MTNEALKLYKLIILYMLNRVDFPMTNSQISKFILEEGYATYFRLQQALAELAESGFIKEEVTYRRTYYYLTEDGAQTIAFFRNDIPAAIQKDIDSFLIHHKYELKDEVSVKADYYRKTNGEYSVCCQVYEHGEPMIELNIAVPSEEEARTAADSWIDKNQEIYAFVMSKLL